jgi:hypothetical protein
MLDGIYSFELQAQHCSPAHTPPHVILSAARRHPIPFHSQPTHRRAERRIVHCAQCSFVSLHAVPTLQDAEWHRPHAIHVLP